MIPSKPAFTKWRPPKNPPSWISTTIDDPDSDFLHWWQDGRCALCNLRVRLVCDHDHDTGLIRGWLCHSCNSQEGWAAPGVSSAIDAWRSGTTPAAFLGLEERYVNSLGVTPMRLKPPSDAHLDAIAERMEAGYRAMRAEVAATQDGQETVAES